ncbi:MAG TPA: SDR family NAD(P)-dependent oxidoreductase [Acidimicrobiales bacterium]|nr:SDR family NAD(P)-dependent oxidoreductase [Acidimicrobiales bacterium]
MATTADPPGRPLPGGAADPDAGPDAASAPDDAAWRVAVVTGASSGIGREMARQLASGGTALVLVARDEVRLHTLADELPVDVEVLAADLADPAALATVEARVADPDRPVDLVVNNAGFGTYGDFATLDRAGETCEIGVNVTAVVRLTHAALGGMLGRGRGAVLNVGSVAGLQATPGNATYGATKAFVASFGEAVAGELTGTGVTLTTVLPGFTRTEFAERAGIGGRRIPERAWMSADDVARQSLDAARAGRPWLVPGMANKLLVAASTPVPRGLKRRIAARLAGRM